MSHLIAKHKLNILQMMSQLRKHYLSLDTLFKDYKNKHDIKNPIRKHILVWIKVVKTDHLFKFKSSYFS